MLDATHPFNEQATVPLDTSRSEGHVRRMSVQSGRACVSVYVIRAKGIAKSVGVARPVATRKASVCVCPILEFLSTWY